MNLSEWHGVAKTSELIGVSQSLLWELKNFNEFTKDLICFYLDNNICPVIETEFASSQKLDSIYSFFRNQK